MSKVIASPPEVAASLSYLADQITRRYSNHNPIVTAVLNGGYYAHGEILRRMDFDLRVDFIRASRYRDAQIGGVFEMTCKPALTPHGETIILIDDIIDDGITMHNIVEWYREKGAAEIAVVALSTKSRIQRVGGSDVTLTGISLPDEFVYGCGMDLNGFKRNLNGIYSVN